MEEQQNYKKIAKDLIASLVETLDKPTYCSADISDIGNEVGIIVGKYIDENIMGYEYSSFIHGIEHGLSFTAKKNNKNKNGKKTSINKGNKRNKPNT